MSNVPLPPIYENHAGKWIDVEDARAHAAAVSAAKDAEIERLRAEVAGLREDAERYRWLRDECPWTMVSGNGKSNLSIRVRAEFDLGDLVDMVDEFDAAIDAARKGEA